MTGPQTFGHGPEENQGDVGVRPFRRPTGVKQMCVCVMESQHNVEVMSYVYNARP